MLMWGEEQAVGFRFLLRPLDARPCQPLNPIYCGFPKFTNEVQHLIKVLVWDENMRNWVFENGVRLPVYTPPAPRSGKSLQVWIARHRPWLVSSSETAGGK